ncbi:hypothetical protein [Microbacterium enclense]|uniref:hypothetical protein n=1 Tax=Microbacterium enclense TaxID=993073 RepID=UPI003D749CB5
MSTSETPETPPLTRRQLRELRNTGATPIIAPPQDAPVDDEAAATSPSTSGDATPPADSALEPPSVESAPAEVTSVETESAAPEPAAKQQPTDEPAPTEETPAKKPGVLGSLFGRGRAEKVEPTAPEAPVEDAPAPEAPVEEAPDASAPVADQPHQAPVQPPVPASFPAHDGGDLGVTRLTRRQVREQERIRTASVPVIAPDLEQPDPAQLGEATAAPAETHVDTSGSEAESAGAASSEPSAATPAEAADDTSGTSEGVSPAIFRPAAVEEAHASKEAVSTVNPALGSDLLAGQTPEVSLPPSFDQLISRSAAATGSVSTPNALILSQTPAGVPLVGPVTSTGEVLITGTFELPEGLGSAGHAPGTTDGRDVDMVLLDGELPPASSPTPIAASAAISTVKQPGEIIRPPAPEKGSKLVIGLIITTGALAVAVAVALVLAFTTGVFG